MNSLFFGFVIALIVMGGFFSFILAHESTHLLLTDEASGICLGRCDYYSPTVEPSTGVSFATAVGVHNEVSVGEFWPDVVALVVFALVVFVGVFCFFDCVEVGLEHDI